MIKRIMVSAAVLMCSTAYAGGINVGVMGDVNFMGLYNSIYNINSANAIAPAVIGVRVQGNDKFIIDIKGGYFAAAHQDADSATQTNYQSKASYKSFGVDVGAIVVYKKPAQLAVLFNPMVDLYSHTLTSASYNYTNPATKKNVTDISWSYNIFLEPAFHMSENFELYSQIGGGITIGGGTHYLKADNSVGKGSSHAVSGGFNGLALGIRYMF